jgi:hypothetical protein
VNDVTLLQSFVTHESNKEIKFVKAWL